MRFLLLAFAFLRTCQAFTSPDIYSITQPAGSSSDPGVDSKPATIPSQSRHAAGPASGLNIFLPDYTQNPNWLPLVDSLKSIGIPVKVSQSLDFTSQCRNLLVYTSFNVTYTPSAADVVTLTSFVKDGGRLIFMSRVPNALLALAGVSAAVVNTTGTRSIMQLTNTETTVQALKGFDFTDYYDISMPFYENYTSRGLYNVGYTPVSGAQTLAKYLVRSTVDSVDTSVTSAALVKYQPSNATGYVYSFGMDLGYLYISAQNEKGGYSQTYDGMYYPGYDIGTRIVKNILSSSDHFVSLWPVPNNMGLAFTTTWDIDTYISYPHGQGIAAAAQDRGAAGNLNLHVKYITDTYENAYFQYGVPYINQITGFRTAADGYPYIDFGSHTVSHSPNAVQFPYGTLSEQYVLGSTSGYAPSIHQCGTGNSDSTPNNGESCTKGGTSGLSFWTSGASASGEIRVSAFLIRHLLNDVFKTNYNLTTYRPGNLAWNKYQSSLCVANGFIGGSSCAGNSHLTHLPFQVGHNREPFQELPYYEFPLQWSDGDGNMSSADFPGSDFSNQVTAIKKMARYGGHYNILIHPSDAIFDKIQIQRALHDAVRPFAVYFNQTGIANWWTNRDRAFVDITAASSSSVSMTVRFDGPAEGLTLNVPKSYVFKSATGSLSVCQQPSYDTFTNAIVLRNTAQGTYTLTFSVSTDTSTASTCPDFTVQPATECVAWDAAIDKYLEPYFYNKGINVLLLETTMSGLTSNIVGGRLQLSASDNSGVNNYYTEISRFCFDASVYTHLFFDMVAPAGSSFLVQLVSYDSGCNTEQGSVTYLDASDYADLDGTNNTVQIRLTDFAGQDFLHVRGIKIVNISPASTPIYIDNIKLQKRCSTAPGDDFTDGLAIESFQNVDRWITGINNIFGKTDHDNSMASAKLAELGKMQLVPSSASSYFYTTTAVNGDALNATGYDSISLSVLGPSGGSFDVIVTSGSGNSNSTVNTGTVATLSSSSFVNVTIPLSSFAGLNSDTVSLITLSNFTPNGGSAATNTFTVRWISLLGGANVTGAADRCQSATGYVVLDFCNPIEFKTQTNALGAPFSDDNTMQYYNQTTNGYINLVAQDSTSYFYSLFNTTACATIDSTNTGIILTVSGPQGATADVGFRHGGTGCKLNSRSDFISITFNTAPTQLTIPFSRFPSPFNAQYLQSFIMTNFNTPGAVYRIHSLVFIGANSVPGCDLCSDTIVDTCTFISTLPRNNLLGGTVTDEGSLTSYSVASDFGLSLGTNSGSYWYSVFGANGCYNATKATGIQLSVAAPANTTFQVALRWMTDAACKTVSSASTVDITTYVTFIGNSTSSQYQLAQIPFTAFSGVNSGRLNSIAISGFSPSGVVVRVGCVSLAGFTTTVDNSATCANCPSTAWLNYCSSGSANKNAPGGVQSDDGTMSVTPAIANGALVLKPAARDSYWYSLMNCMDISSYDTLYINLTATAGASFNVKLQTSSNACADASQIQSASVASTAYGTMTGSSVLLAIPLSAYTSQNSAIKLSALYALVLESFSSGTPTLSLNCAYYGISTNTTKANSTITASANITSTTSASTTFANTTISAFANTTSAAFANTTSSAFANTTSAAFANTIDAVFSNATSSVFANTTSAAFVNTTSAAFANTTNTASTNNTSIASANTISTVSTNTTGTAPANTTSTASTRTTGTASTNTTSTASTNITSFTNSTSSASTKMASFTNTTSTTSATSTSTTSTSSAKTTSSTSTTSAKTTSTTSTTSSKTTSTTSAKITSTTSSKTTSTTSAKTTSTTTTKRARNVDRQLHKPEDATIDQTPEE
ncbi:polysaccharide deacetylase [Seiridium cupressi]